MNPAKLRKLIENSHKTILNIEKEAGLSKNALHPFLSGRVKKPHEDSLRGLAAVFGLELDEFIHKISDDASDSDEAKSLAWNGELFLQIINIVHRYISDNDIKGTDLNYVLSVSVDLYAYAIEQNTLDSGTCEVLLRFAFKNMKK